MTPRDWSAASYQRVSAPLEAMGREVLDRLELRGDERVLDAGCGTGRVTAALLERLPRGEVVAVDGSPAMVEEARERLGFTDVRTWSQEVRVEPEDPSEYLATVMLGSHLERVPEARRDAFVEAVLAALPEPAIDYVRLNLTARRADAA